MWNNRFDRGPGDRTERWRREDAASRLIDEVPALQTLVLALREVRETFLVSGSERKQHVIVSRAAALFEIACSEPRCQDGGHDLTLDVLHNLRKGNTEFASSSECRGTLGNAGCRRELHYSARATYTGR